MLLQTSQLHDAPPHPIATPTSTPHRRTAGAATSRQRLTAARPAWTCAAPTQVSSACCGLAQLLLPGPTLVYLSVPHSVPHGALIGCTVAELDGCLTTQPISRCRVQGGGAAQRGDECGGRAAPRAVRFSCSPGLPGLCGEIRIPISTFISSATQDSWVAACVLGQTGHHCNRGGQAMPHAGGAWGHVLSIIYPGPPSPLAPCRSFEEFAVRSFVDDQRQVAWCPAPGEELRPAEERAWKARRALKHGKVAADGAGVRTCSQGVGGVRAVLRVSNLLCPTHMAWCPCRLPERGALTSRQAGRGTGGCPALL